MKNLNVLTAAGLVHMVKNGEKPKKLNGLRYYMHAKSYFN